MVTASLLLAAALQAAAAPAASAAPPAEICALVTPRGDVLHFAAMPWSEDGSRLGLAPAQGSAWPADAIVGTRNRAGRFGFGREGGVVFELGARVAGRLARSATLYRNQGDGLPLAFGFCQPGPAPDVADAVDTSAQPAAVGADIPAFDPQNWPIEDCGLLLSDGRRVRFGYHHVGPDRVNLTSADLWPGETVTASSGEDGKTAAQVFRRPGGPDGVVSLVVVPPRGASLIRILHLGVATAPDLTAYGICGYREVVRRPTLESSRPVSR